VHWLDSLEGPLAEPIKERLRGYPDIQAAWNMLPHGPWLLRLGFAAKRDRTTRADLRDLANEIASETQADMENYVSLVGDKDRDSVALAYEYLVMELAAAGEGRGPDLTEHRASASSMKDFDATLDDLYKKTAGRIRARMPNAPR
jgi:hypothetical protein